MWEIIIPLLESPFTEWVIVSLVPILIINFTFRLWGVLTEI